MRRLGFLSFALLPFLVWTQTPSYGVDIDLRDTNQGILHVEMTPPPLQTDKATLVFPAIIPGTYEQDDFGRYIQDLTVEYQDGTKMKVRGKNTFVVKDPSKVKHIRYTARETWAEEKNTVFEPAGTTFQPGACDLLNFHALVGFYLGHQDLPFELSIEHGDNMYGAGSLPKRMVSAVQDSLWAENYDHLADSPMMYAVFSEMDTVTIPAGGCTVQIAVFSEGKKVNAQMIKPYVEPAVTTAADALGELMPQKYTFLFYMPSKPLYAFGALEHKRSSVYYLPDDPEQLDFTLGNTVSHEFFHILTPLHLHSDLIEPFDFHTPRMSRHLWLYEGVTEYLSMKNNLAAGLIDTVEFFEELLEKDFETLYYKAMPLIDGSTKVLSKKGQDHYGNFYAKGALVAFAMDVTLLDKSQGEFGLMDLMRELISTYGMKKPFADEGLIAEILDGHPELMLIVNSTLQGKADVAMPELMASLGVAVIRKEKEESDNPYSFSLKEMGIGLELRTKDASENALRKTTLSF